MFSIMEKRLLPVEPGSKMASELFDPTNIFTNLGRQNGKH